MSEQSGASDAEAAEPVFRAGELVADRYRVVSPVGRGGFAQVYRAVHVELDTPIALKVLLPERMPGTDEDGEDEAFIERYRQEARVISRLKSPSTVNVLDFGQTESGDLYMALEFVEGETLRTLIAREAPVGEDRTARILRQILESLREAHSLDVIHRDIKPENVMVYEHLGERDLVKVLDFGIAKILGYGMGTSPQTLTGPNRVLGTPRYMAPEYANALRLSPAIDVYSAGLVAYELLSGFHPFDHPDARITDSPPDPTLFRLPQDVEISDALRRLIDRMISRDPAGRVRTVEEALAALEAVDAGEEVVRPLAETALMQGPQEGETPPTRDLKPAPDDEPDEPDEPPQTEETPQSVAMSFGIAMALVLGILFAGFLGLRSLTTGGEKQQREVVADAGRTVAAKTTTPPDGQVASAPGPDAGGEDAGLPDAGDELMPGTIDLWKEPAERPEKLRLND